MNKKIHSTVSMVKRGEGGGDPEWDTWEKDLEKEDESSLIKKRNILERELQKELTVPKHKRSVKRKVSHHVINNSAVCVK